MKLMISSFLKFLVPRNAMCSTKWARPCWSSSSRVEPALTANQISARFAGRALRRTNQVRPLSSRPVRIAGSSGSLADSAIVAASCEAMAGPGAGAGAAAGAACGAGLACWSVARAQPKKRTQSSRTQLTTLSRIRHIVRSVPVPMGAPGGAPFGLRGSTSQPQAASTYVDRIKPLNEGGAGPPLEYAYPNSSVKRSLDLVLSAVPGPGSDAPCPTHRASQGSCSDWHALQRKAARPFGDRESVDRSRARALLLSPGLGFLGRLGVSVHLLLHVLKVGTDRVGGGCDGAGQLGVADVESRRGRGLLLVRHRLQGLSALGVSRGCAYGYTRDLLPVLRGEDEHDQPGNQNDDESEAAASLSHAGNLGRGPCGGKCIFLQPRPPCTDEPVSGIDVS